MINSGWWIIASDYKGLKAEYTAGLIAGYATLDSIHLALKEGPALGLSKSPPYGLWEYSGGALASTWAVELQPSYASELKIAGAAFGGTIPNVKNVLFAINNSSFSGLSFSGIWGLAKAYPNLTNYLNQKLDPSKAEEFWKLANCCLGSVSSQGSNQDLFSYTTDGRAILDDPVPASVLQWAGISGLRGTPTAPLCIYKTIGDEVSPRQGH